MADKSLKKNQWCVLSISPMDDRGSAAPVKEDTLEFVFVDPDQQVIIIEQFGEDLLQKKVTALSPGTVTFTVTVKNTEDTVLSALAVVEVTPTLAVRISLLFGQSND